MDKNKPFTSLNTSIVSCRLCKRLVDWRETVAQKRKRSYQDEIYWGKPILGFGDTGARVLVVGLAPGAHGSNRTGRIFTGDASGNFLYPALYRASFANQPNSTDILDGLELKDIFITSSCRCVPPGNKPTPDEIRTCRPFLLAELELLPNIQGIVALGRVAFDNILTIYKTLKPLTNPTVHSDIDPAVVMEGALPSTKIPTFAHNALFHLDDTLPWLLASYHPSRQNTQTGRLTLAMFEHTWNIARSLLV
jgi:uracil-DNA glycosylase